MPITLVPAEGSYIKNFQIIDTGGVFDSNNKIIKQGVFAKGRLNGPHCSVVNYGGEDISIRKGAYTAGAENGEIFEYVFVQSEWEKLFVAGESLAVTRYTHTFVNGVWNATSASNTKKITASRRFNTKGYLVEFTFSELD